MAIHRAMIPERCAWRSAAIGGKDGLVARLTEAHLAALDTILARVRALPTEKITRREFDHPAINRFMHEVADEISDGHGAVIIQGCSYARYSPEDFERIFWGLGLYLGRATPQTARGDLIDHIRDFPDNPTDPTRRRGQYGREELVLHTDNPTGQILGLMCMQKAKSGGVSQMASALAVHNEIFAARPDLLEPLYRGSPYHRKGRQRPGEPENTTYNVPVFCDVDGLVSCRYVRRFIDVAAQVAGTALPAGLVEAMDFLDATANRSDISVHFMLEPGEILFFNNLTILHARTEFEDHDEWERKRHLLRLLLDVPNARPFAPEMNMFLGTRIDHAAEPAAAGD